MEKYTTLKTTMDYKKLYEQSQKENEKLKKEQFDEMEKIAKQQGMCLVDIPIFDKLIEKEQENEELKNKLQKLGDEIIKADGCKGAYSHPLDLIESWVYEKIDEIEDEDEDDELFEEVMETEESKEEFLADDY